MLLLSASGQARETQEMGSRMILFIIFLAVIIIWRVYESLQQHDSFGPVVGLATRYEECPLCSTPNCQAPRGRGEVITRGGFYVVRQYHVCLNCNGKALWHRTLDGWIWTVRRSGVTR